MKNQDYHAEISANIPIEKAFDSIANVSGWWAKNFEGSAKKQNDVFKVTFGPTFVDFKIAEAVPNKKIVWEVTDCYLHWIEDKTEWNGTKIVWELMPENNTTHISMTHIGLVPASECYESCKPGWDGHVKGSLLKLMTEGKGNPE